MFRALKTRPVFSFKNTHNLINQSAQRMKMSNSFDFHSKLIKVIDICRLNMLRSSKLEPRIQNLKVFQRKSKWISFAISEHMMKFFLVGKKQRKFVDPGYCPLFDPIHNFFVHTSGKQSSFSFLIFFLILR